MSEGLSFFDLLLRSGFAWIIVMLPVSLFSMYYAEDLLAYFVFIQAIVVSIPVNSYIFLSRNDNTSFNTAERDFFWRRFRRISVLLYVIVVPFVFVIGGFGWLQYFNVIIVFYLLLLVVAFSSAIYIFWGADV